MNYKWGNRCSWQACDLMLLRRVGNPSETEVDVSRPLVFTFNFGAWFRPSLFLQSRSSIQLHWGMTGIDREGGEREGWGGPRGFIACSYFCRLTMGQTRAEKVHQNVTQVLHSANFTHEDQFTHYEENNSVCENSCTKSSMAMRSFLKSEKLILIMASGYLNPAWEF